jgi:hypothetical protein
MPNPTRVAETDIKTEYQNRYQNRVSKPVPPGSPHPHLDPTPPGMKPMKPTARPLASGNAEAELDRQACQIEREDHY